VLSIIWKDSLRPVHLYVSTVDVHYRELDSVVRSEQLSRRDDGSKGKLVSLLSETGVGVCSKECDLFLAEKGGSCVCVASSTSVLQNLLMVKWDRSASCF
jgi:hypothetical protein